MKGWIGVLAAIVAPLELILADLKRPVLLGRLVDLGQPLVIALGDLELEIGPLIVAQVGDRGGVGAGH